MMMARIRIDDLDGKMDLTEKDLDAVVAGSGKSPGAFGVSKLLPKEAFPAAAPSNGLGL